MPPRATMAARRRGWGGRRAFWPDAHLLSPTGSPGCWPSREQPGAAGSWGAPTEGRGCTLEAQPNRNPGSMRLP